MTESTFSVDELRTLTNMACNGELTKQAVAQLERLLYDNAQAQQFYLTHVCLDRRLRWEFAHQVQKPAIPLSAPSLGIFSTVIHGTIGFFSQELQFSLLIATLLTGIGLWIASLVYVSSPEKIAKDSLPPMQSSFKPNLEVIGKITGTVGVHWADINTSTESGNSVFLGRKYVLISGLMEITYKTGAKVILQGPCSYQADSFDGGFLSFGKLTARVEKKQSVISNQPSPKKAASHLLEASTTNPESAIPDPSLPSIPTALFTIKTPTAVVTDLGTEFGVEVDKETTTLQVFHGTVKIAASDARGITQTGEIILHENEVAYVKLDASRPAVIRRLPRDVAQFTRTMPLQEQSQQASERRSEAYGQMVLSMQPTLYYRMEPPEDGDPKVLYDSAPGKHHGAIHFADGYVDTTPYVQGRFGHSLRLRGPMVGDYALVKDYPKTTDGRLTVSAWVLAMGRATPAIIAGNWRSNWQRHDGQFVFYFSYLTNGNFAGRGVEENGQQVILQEGQTWESAFPLATWQHVAQVFDGATMRLYRNGIEVASRPCRGLTPNPSLKWMTIGCEATDSLDRLIGYWQGKIDELALFNRTLSVEEIRRLSNHVEVRR